MLEPQNLEGSTMVANKGSDQKAITINYKSVYQLRVSNYDNKDNLWCTYYQKVRHIRERCQKLYGKPSTSRKE